MATYCILYITPSIGEWMEISPEKLKISRGESPTLTMTFLQLEGLDIKLNEVQIVYHPSQNDSEELLLANIPAIKLKDSVAVYNVNSTLLNNGSISVEALFAVNNVTHKVESAVEVMCKNCIFLSACIYTQLRSWSVRYIDHAAIKSCAHMHDLHVCNVCLSIHKTVHI